MPAGPNRTHREQERTVKPKLYVGLFVDCEATQPAIGDPDLGRRADTGIAEVLESAGLRGTFHLLPTDAEANAPLYRDLLRRGHEIGLHVHPTAQGYEQEFFGAYGPAEQRTILAEARDRVAAAIGSPPGSLCVGYASTNDHSYPIFVELGFRHGMTSIPTRVLPECAAVHAGAPLSIHYAHRHNRLLPGDLDYVEVPVTLDPQSRLWGGKHPQDLRVELVDAKSHYYTVRQAVERQLAERPPVYYVLAMTHNVFEYGDPKDFRRQTLESVIRHVRSIASEKGLEVVPATIREIAAAYRAAAPLPTDLPPMRLDRRPYESASTTA